MTDRVMVPVVPTEAMVEAAYDCPIAASQNQARAVWSAMIAAAPPSERWVSNGGDGEYPDLVMVPVGPVAVTPMSVRAGTGESPNYSPVDVRSYSMPAHPPKALSVEEVAGIIRDRAGYTEYGPVVPEALVDEIAQAIIAAMGRAA